MPKRTTCTTRQKLKMLKHVDSSCSLSKRINTKLLPAFPSAWIRQGTSHEMIIIKSISQLMTPVWRYQHYKWIIYKLIWNGTISAFCGTLLREARSFSKNTHQSNKDLWRLHISPAVILLRSACGSVPKKVLYTGLPCSILAETLLLSSPFLQTASLSSFSGLNS